MQAVLRFTLGTGIKAEWMYKMQMLLCTLKPPDLHKHVCLRAVILTEKIMQLDCGLESFALDKWTPCRHRIALKKISYFVGKDQPHYPTIQQSINQKKKAYFKTLYLHTYTLHTLTALMHLYSVFSSGEHRFQRQIQLQPEKGFWLWTEEKKSESRFTPSWESGTASFKKSCKLLNLQWLNNVSFFCGIWFYCIIWHFYFRRNMLPAILCNVK